VSLIEINASVLGGAGVASLPPPHAVRNTAIMAVGVARGM
jgi:hypothetical protein